MCFKNLPIEFDAQGNAVLKAGLADPYQYERKDISREQLRELMARNGYIRSVDFDPVTRVAGALAFHSVVDLQARKVLEANSMATLFRGYEVILKGRDPRDAIFISSRACGVCGGVHATCAALAIEMAFGICPPPLAIVVRNLALSMEFVWDNVMHLFMLAGPDYSEAMLQRTEPSLWERATRTETRWGHLHGYNTMADLLHDMNPLTGKLYLTALEMTRVARRVCHADEQVPTPRDHCPGRGQSYRHGPEL
jgi:hydrogenase large subunit